MSKPAREVLFTVKNCFRDKGYVFWNVVYPIILCMFFYLAFSSVIGERRVQFDVGVAEANPISSFMKEIEVFRVVDMEEGEAEEALRDKKIVAYVNSEGNMVATQSGIGQTTTQNVLRMYKQISYLFQNGGDPRQVDFGADTIQDQKKPYSSYTIIFYSLLAMVSFYGVFGGIYVMENFQAGNSEIAKRMVISPIHKGRYILVNIFVVFCLNILSNTLLLLFINYILGIRLFTDFLSSYLLILCGNIWGISLGVLIGCIGRLSSGVRTMFGIVVPLLLSAFAGMMSPEIKIMIMEKAPLLDFLNPASIITGSLYRVNLLSNDTDIWVGMAVILIMSLLFFLVSLRSLRRKSYDSF